MNETCDIPRVAPNKFPDPMLKVASREGLQTGVLAGGCFWCVEAVFKEMDGVVAVRSGYAGGTPETAEYDAVCSGATGHAEAIEVRFDPSRVTYGQLLKVFLSVAHDPPSSIDRGRIGAGSTARPSSPRTRSRRRSPAPMSASSTKPAFLARPS